VAMPAVLIVATAGALALATFLKAGAILFLGAPRTKAAAHAHESGPLMLGSMSVLAVSCLMLALAPVFFWPAIARATGVWNSKWSEMEVSVPLATLSWVHVSLAVLFVAGGGWLWRRAHARGVRRALTWDCGYSAPNPRMQYTSGSFAALGRAWFVWILRPVRSGRRLRGFFPRSSVLIERVPETVLEHVIEPGAALVMQISRAARRLQQGRLQFYIAYLAGGIAALAIMVWLGETR